MSNLSPSFTIAKLRTKVKLVTVNVNISVIAIQSLCIRTKGHQLAQSDSCFLRKALDMGLCLPHIWAVTHYRSLVVHIEEGQCQQKCKFCY